MIATVLGTHYIIEYKKQSEDPKLLKCDGYCDYTTKRIVCLDRRKTSKMDVDNLDEVRKRILRHELLHAFMYESGLWCNTFGVDTWSENEEMTDWFAIQSPKIFELYKDLNLL